MRTTFATRIILCTALVGASPTPKVRQHLLSTRSVQIVHQGGLNFRDLNRNRRLDPYEDWRLPPSLRAKDLLARMTLTEKLGQMMHDSLIANGANGVADGYDMRAADELVLTKHVTAAITRLAADPVRLATANNEIQARAEFGRLGIPVTISSDPRHQLGGTNGASIAAGDFTAFPDPLGIAAIDDPAFTRRYADIVRREYAAVGIRMALSPQADLATEPRWPRIDGTFGGDPRRVARMVGAYVTGLQGTTHGLGLNSVAAVVKHWVGYGAAAIEGFDSHNFYGRFSAVTDATLPLHIAPFRAAFAAHAAAVMPMYSVPRDLTDGHGHPLPAVAAGYSRYLLTDLLRSRYGFSGVILSDWAITNDCNAACRHGAPNGTIPNWADASTAWGVEDLSTEDRFAKGVEAGIDQFGGTADVASLGAAVRDGKLSVGQIDRAVLRVLIQTFALGLFDSPFVDPAAAGRIVGNTRFRAEGRAAQARALVVLDDRRNLLPLSPKRERRLFAPDLSAAAVTALGFIAVTHPNDADIAILRVATPHQNLHPGFPAGSVQHEGALDFQNGDPALERFRRVKARVPTIVIVRLDRPAVLTNIRAGAAVLVADFGATDSALLDGLTGRTKHAGRLPIELPSSMAAVARQRPAVPHDSADPLYPIGYRSR